MNNSSPVDIDEVIECAYSDDYVGFCLECGHQHFEVEPDARKYKCENCGELSVYGCQEILMMTAV